MNEQILPSEPVLPPDVCLRYTRLYTPLLSDTMERLGRRGMSLDPRIQSISPDPYVKMVGFAYPCQVRATTTYVEIDNLLRMVDSIPIGAVVVVASDHDSGCALWGGLMSAGAKKRGAVGAIVNGGVRDLAQIADVDFIVFGRGRTMLDIRTRGEMVDFACTVECGGVTIHPGDLIVGDANGVICVPRAIILDLLEACEVARTQEEDTRIGLNQGDAAAAVYQRYGRF